MAETTRARSNREARRISQFGKFRHVELNLVPLVDTFVSLVFFTLLTQATATIPVAPGVVLPESKEGNEARERVTLSVGSRPALITLNGREVLSVRQAATEQSNDPNQPLVIPRLQAVLSQAADSVRRLRGTAAEQPVPDQLAIHGDRTMRYDLLSRIMQTARVSGFTNITLQVQRTVEGDAAGGIPVQQASR